MADAIEIKNLNKKFRSTLAVNNLSLAIPEGCIFGLLGPNGAGKTTTIKLLLNLIRPSSGSAKVLGVEANKLDSKTLQKIGYVSENQELPSWMRLRSFLSFCEAIHWNWDQKLAEELVEGFSLDRHQKIGQMSRGMQMKVALISVLAYHPELLILDEPFSGLDPLTRDELIRGLIDFTTNNKWTVLMSSHDIYEVERLADRIAFVNQGRDCLVEDIDRLQERFRRVHITCKDSEKLVIPSNFPGSWIVPSVQDRSIRFVDSDFKGLEPYQEFLEKFFELETIDAEEMSLREIFVCLAKQHRMTGITGGNNEKN